MNISLKKLGFILLIVGVILVVLGGMTTGDQPWVPFIYDLYQNTLFAYVTWGLTVIGLILLIWGFIRGY